MQEIVECCFAHDGFMIHCLFQCPLKLATPFVVFRKIDRTHFLWVISRIHQTTLGGSNCIASNSVARLLFVLNMVDFAVGDFFSFLVVIVVVNEGAFHTN